MEPAQTSKTRAQTGKSENSGQGRSGLDEIHERIQSRLDELHADFKQLEADLRAGNQASLRAHKDRIEGYKQALRDIVESTNRADMEWH
jgi:pyruvate-formate lyase